MLFLKVTKFLAIIIAVLALPLWITLIGLLISLPLIFFVLVLDRVMTEGFKNGSLLGSRLSFNIATILAGAASAFALFSYLMMNDGISNKGELLRLTLSIGVATIYTGILLATGNKR